MIGIRAGLSTALATALCAAVLTGTEGPGPDLAVDRLVAQRAGAAVAALDSLEAAMAPAVEAARIGAARTVSGDEPASEAFDAAADALGAAEPGAREAAVAVDRLDAARGLREPGAEAIGVPIPAGELGSIAAQLRATGEAGDAFAEVRHSAATVGLALERALAALDAGDLDAAQRATEEARGAREAVAALESAPRSLAVWLETTGAMIGAMERIVTATRAGDPDAARRAAEKFAALEDEAATADRALRIAVSEGGNALASTALRRLAGQLDAVASARARVVGIIAGPRP
jgi:hypothetical protein